MSVSEEVLPIIAETVVEFTAKDPVLLSVMKHLD